MGEKYYPPEFKKEAFHCPHCQVYAEQSWKTLLIMAGHPSVWWCRCSYCNKFSVWIVDKYPAMLYPSDFHQGPPPHDDMPEEFKADYLEALSIVSKSPRGAAALLRLVLQKLLIQLGGKGKNMDKDIESLVKKGLPEEIQVALDTVRVIGNEAVHPGRLDLRDDRETAMMLFELINFIVEEQIARKKKRAAFIEKLPEPIRKKIQRT